MCAEDQILACHPIHGIVKVWCGRPIFVGAHRAEQDCDEKQQKKKNVLLACIDPDFEITLID